MAGMDPITIHYKDDDGKDLSTTSGQIYQQLTQNGYQVKGVSADGMTFHFADPRGDFDMNAQDVLQNLGFQVSHVVPTNPDESKINLNYRLAISRLPDDDAKKAYLQSKLKREGVEDPKVVGKGRDFFYYDPQSNAWHALTNSSGWDTGDLAEAGLAAVHGVGAGLGSVAGGVVGNIPGAMAGAGAGGALAEGAIRTGLNYLDPEYADVTTLKGQLKDIGLEAGVDAALGGLPGGLAKAAPYLGATEEGLKTFLRSGPISTVAKGLGKTMQAGGNLAATAGHLASTPMGKEAVKAFTPGLSQAQLLATGLKAPEYLTVAGAKAAQKAAGSELASSALGAEEAAAAKQGIDEIISKKAPEGILEKFNKWARGTSKPSDIKASNVLQNVGEKLAKSAGAEEAGIETAKRYGAKTGKTMEEMATLGRNIDKASDVAVTGAATAVKGLGAGSQLAGKALHAGGQIMQPFEYQALGQAAANEKLLPGIREKLMEQERKALLQKMNQGTIDKNYTYQP